MLGAARPVEGEPFLSWRPHFRLTIILGLFGVGGAGRARARAAHCCLGRRGPSSALVAGGRARRGISRVGVAGGVGTARPNSLLAGFPQRTCDRSVRARENEPETQRSAGRLGICSRGRAARWQPQMPRTRPKWLASVLQTLVKLGAPLAASSQSDQPSTRVITRGIQSSGSPLRPSSQDVLAFAKYMLW